MAVRVCVELLDVTCSDTEDEWGVDDFYLVGGLTAPGTTQTFLTTPFPISAGESKSFQAGERILFEGDVPGYAVVKGGMQAFDEDYYKDWEKRLEWLAKLQEVAFRRAGEMSNSMRRTENYWQPLLWSPTAFFSPAGQVIKAVFEAFRELGKSYRDDLLGETYLEIPAWGQEVEEKRWAFIEKGLKGSSSWNYTLRYRITRAVPGVVTVTRPGSTRKKAPFTAPQ